MFFVLFWWKNNKDKPSNPLFIGVLRFVFIILYRHSHCALLIEMKQPILLISERLGHETVDTTWNTYAHLYPNKGVALAEELQKMKI